MKRFRFELVAIALFAVLIGLAALAPTSAHAESGCPDPDQRVNVGYFHLGWNCNVSGDVSMRDPSSGTYQRLYDDDDASTGLIVHCNAANGCDGYANWGGWDSGQRDIITMVVDTFKYVPGLRYVDTKCFPVNCGTTRYFPSYSPPYYTTSDVTVPAPPVPSNRQYFSANTPVIGGWIYINGTYVGYSCYVPSAWGSGYVDFGTTHPQFTQGATVTLCTGGTTVPNPAPPVVSPTFPWPFPWPWPYPLVSPTSGTTPDVCALWGCKNFGWNDMVVGGVIYLNDGSVYVNCFVSNAHPPGTQVSGYPLNPSSNYGMPQCDGTNRVR